MTLTDADVAELVREAFSQAKTRVEELNVALAHQVLRDHDYAPHICTGCEQAQTLLARTKGAV